VEQVSPTRMALLQLRSQLKLAQQGRDLLEQKREALMREFMATADVAMQESLQLDAAAAESAHALALARAIDGPHAVRSAALASTGVVQVEVTGTKVMGVPVPQIEARSARRSLLDRGYSLVATSARIDEAAEAFENEVNLVIAVATSEKRLQRLGNEIRSTSRRVNALDNRLIPELRTEIKLIAQRLEEREIEDAFRLKRVKALLTRAREEGSARVSPGKREDSLHATVSR